MYFTPFNSNCCNIDYSNTFSVIFLFEKSKFYCASLNSLVFLYLQCVEITSCGNFGLIGYSSGHVDIYNMQSGLHRGSYGNPKGTSITDKGMETLKLQINGVKNY